MNGATLSILDPTTDTLYPLSFGFSATLTETPVMDDDIDTIIDNLKIQWQGQESSELCFTEF